MLLVEYSVIYESELSICLGRRFAIYSEAGGSLVFSLNYVAYDLKHYGSELSREYINDI